MSGGDAFVLDPKLRAGPQRSPAESGVGKYAVGEAVATTPDATRAKLVAQLENSVPVPVAVHCALNTNNAPNDWDITLGNVALNAGIDQGGLVLEWGDMKGSHRTICDFRSGTYQLPACTYARALALAWRVTGTLANAYAFNVALSRGVVTSPKCPQYTVVGTLGNGVSVSVVPNSYARLFDVWASGWNGGAGGIGTLNAPIIRVPALGIERNYQIGLYAPPWGPVEVERGNYPVVVTNDGPAPVDVYAKFLLEW